MWIDDTNESIRSRPLRRHLRPHSLLALVSIGCWSVSLVLDFASRTAVDPGSAVPVSTSLIGYGLLAAAAAAVAGFVDALPVPAKTASFRMASFHFGLMISGYVVYLTGYVLRRAEPVDQPVGLQVLVVSLIGAAFVLTGAVVGVLLAHRRV